MIRPININLNAAHPELPLVEATTFTGAPSSVFIRGVPKSVGNWSITAVSVAVTYPDNTTTARAAVESAEGVWVATIPGTATSGRTAAGFKIMADGIDENGAAVTGYVLGFADFSVLSFTPVPAPGGTFYLLRYFDQAPATPKEGDVAVVDGLLKMYNGTEWAGFGDGPGFSTDDPQMAGTASPGSADTAARSDHVHPTDTSRASVADATLTDAATWVCDPPNYSDNPITIVRNDDGFAPSIGGVISGTTKGDETSTDLEWTSDWIGGAGGITLTATRAATNGYVLGSQSDKPLASEAEAVALRTGKMSAAATGADILVGGSGGAASSSIAAAIDDIFRVMAPLDSPTFTGTPIAPTAQDGDNSTLLATTAFVQGAVGSKLDSTSAAPAFSSDSSTQYAVGSHCTYQGKLYKCTTATTGGTWVAGNWTADTMTDPDAVLDITAQNQLRVVAKDGTLLWAQGYDLASTSSATLACDAVNNFTFADGATSQAFALPTAPTGKVGDFGLDIDNSANTGAATMTLTGLDTTFSVVVPEGESLTDMLAIAAGELARFYITLSTFRVNNLPTWHIVKQVVENGGAQS